MLLSLHPMNCIPRFVRVCSKTLLLAGLAALLGGCGKEEKTGKAGAGPSTGEGRGSQGPLVGYTLVEQLLSHQTDLIDMEGKVVHRWMSDNPNGGGTYLLPNGDLLQSEVMVNNPFNSSTPGLSGLVERLDSDGKRNWQFTCPPSEKSLHHDVYLLPNGNVLMVGVETIPRDKQIELGRQPERATKDMWLDFLIEVKPTGESGGDIVWEWHLADHLVQEIDKTKKNFGVVADHPELLDINAVINPLPMNAATLKQLSGLGYVGNVSAANLQGGGLPDWTHVNSIVYNPKLDQVLMSVRSLGELWIIDHSPGTEDAKGHKGGKLAKGGDLIYRWGNPQIYQRGQPKEQMFFGQHDAEWIPEGCPGAGDIMVFNNGEGRKDGEYSTVDEITPPLKADGSYELEAGQAYGPTKLTWHYEAKRKEDFHSTFLSGVQRLSNGNTLICSGVQGRMFELGQGDKIVWEQDRKVAFVEPGKSGAVGRAGPGGPGGPGGGGPGGGQGRGGRGGGLLAGSMIEFSVGCTGQVAMFGMFEFYKVFGEVAAQRRGSGGGPGGPRWAWRSWWTKRARWSGRTRRPRWPRRTARSRTGTGTGPRWARSIRR